MIFKTYFNLSILILLMAAFSGCATMGGMADGSGASKQRFAEINESMNKDELAVLKAGAKELKADEQDLATRRELGKILFRIAASNRSLKTSVKAKKLLESVLEEDSGRADAMAYLGATNTIIARDLDGILYWLTPLGFIRFKRVNDGVSQMDKAVEMDEANPEVRLVRGLSCVNMPSVFGQYDKGLSDLKTLEQWAKNPEGRKYSFMLPEIGATAVYTLAGIDMREGRHEQAMKRFALAARLSPGSATGTASMSMSQILAFKN